MNPLLNWLADLLGRLKSPETGKAPDIAQVMAYEAQSFPETLARIAESQVGVRESGGNNKGPQVQAYQSTTWLAGTGWAWCAAFVCWCLWQALQKTGITPKGWKRPRTAGAYDFENWANGIKPHGPNTGWRCQNSTLTDPPRRGDIITFTWSHIGIVTGYDATMKVIYTVEGNAGVQDRSDGPSGDGVVAKKYHVTKCRKLIRYIGEGKV
jgi:hypothetical protein